MKFLGLILTLLLTGCADAVKDLIEDTVNAGKVVPVPVVSSLKFSNNNSPILLTGPFVSTVDVVGDLGKGSCGLYQIEIVVEGTLEPLKVNTIEILGAATVDTTISKDSFVSVLCLEQGATALGLKAISAAQSKSEAFNLSINANSGFITIGWGHPTYPSTGFRTGSSRLLNPIESQNYTLENVSVETFRSQSLGSTTGDANYTLDMGYLNLVGQAK